MFWLNFPLMILTDFPFLNYVIDDFAALSGNFLCYVQGWIELLKKGDVLVTFWEFLQILRNHNFNQFLSPHNMQRSTTFQFYTLCCVTNFTKTRGPPFPLYALPNMTLKDTYDQDQKHIQIKSLGKREPWAVNYLEKK